MIKLNRTNKYMDELKIVSDPLPVEEGGYRPGTHFPAVNVRENIVRGGFTDGTVLADNKGNEYIYIQREITDAG